MAMIAALGLAAALTAPALGEAEIMAVGGRVAQLRIAKNVAAEIEVVIGPDGQPRSCRLLRQEGSPEMAGAICPAMMGVRFRHVARVNGQPEYGIVRDLFAAGVGLKPVPQMTPDIVIEVAALPKVSAGYLDVPVAAHVDGDGRVIACESISKPNKYVPIACEQVKMNTFRKIADEQAKPLPYVTKLVARFAVSKVTAGTAAE